MINVQAQSNSSLPSLVRPITKMTPRHCSYKGLVLYSLPMDDSVPGLASQAQLFRDIFNASPIGIVVETTDGRPVLVNPAFCNLLGFTEEEIRSKHCVDFSPKEDAEKDWALFQRLKAGEINSYQLDKRYFRKDGSCVWGRLSLSLLDNSACPLVIAMVEEITDRKRAEEALCASEERFRLAQEAARFGTFERDLQTGLVTWSSEVDAMYGLPPGAFDRTPFEFFLEMVYPEDRAKIVQWMEESPTGGKRASGEWRVRWPDGSLHWIDGHWQVVRDEANQPKRLVGVNMDVTARKVAEEALRDSDEKFRRLFREAGFGIVMVSPDGRFLAANNSFCKYLGYTQEELLQKTVESVTLAEDWPAFSDRLQQLLTNEDSRMQWFEKRCLHQSGRIVYTESTAWLIRDSKGSPLYFVGEVLDITERKKAEAALLDVTRKLIEAQEQERARIGRELHDDINQRLAMLSVELAEMQKDPLNADTKATELRKHLSEISEAVHALSHELHSSKLEYLGVVAGMKSWCKEFGERHNLEIVFFSDVDRQLPREIGVTLFRVLQEALQNAFKHSGVKKVDVALHASLREIQLTVTDAGIGFDPQAAIQDRGLGLISMQERVRLVDGVISIDSKPTCGTRIDITIPIQQELRATA